MSNKSCIFFHSWSSWSTVVDTDTYFRKAQFRKCNLCNKVEHRFINTFKKGNSNHVSASTINEALK